MKYLMNQTNWQCKCKPELGYECCGNLFEAMSCHKVWPKLKTGELSGWIQRDGAFLITGDAGVHDLALARDKSGDVVLIVSERANDLLASDVFAFSNLIDYDPEHLAPNPY